MSIWVSKEPQSIIQRSKRFSKNIQKHVLQEHESGKNQGNYKISCFPQFFSFNLAIFQYFVKRFFSFGYSLERRMFLCPCRHILRRNENTFLSQNAMRWSNLIIVKNAFCTCFLKLKILKIDSSQICEKSFTL